MHKKMENSRVLGMALVNVYFVLRVQTENGDRICKSNDFRWFLYAALLSEGVKNVACKLSDSSAHVSIKALFEFSPIKLRRIQASTLFKYVLYSISFQL